MLQKKYYYHYRKSWHRDSKAKSSGIFDENQWDKMERCHNSKRIDKPQKINHRKSKIL